MKALVVGIGAAGNKSVVSLLEAGVITEKDMLLLNSTLKDIPEEYKDKAIKLSDEEDGCGKERTLAKQITAEALNSGRLDLDNGILQADHEKVIIVASTEGGTGSGASAVVADYCYNELGMNVEIFAFKGFEEDARGIANTIEFFQDLQPYYSVQVIRNDSFMKDAGNNIKRAQKMANDELATRLRISLGQVIVDSEDNIDDTELYKVTNTSGYATIEYRALDDKIKSTEEFARICTEMIDGTRSLSLSTPSANRIAIIMNLQESSQNNVDYSFSTIKDKLGVPYELFKHIQYDKTQNEFIAIIASGMKMPIEELKALNMKYNNKSNETDKTEDGFFDQVRSMKGNPEDSRFDMGRRRRRVPRNTTTTSTEVHKSGFSAKVKDTIVTEADIAKMDNKEY